MVLFPAMFAPLVVTQEKSVQLANDAMRANRLIAVVAQRQPDRLPVRASDLYRFGTMALAHDITAAGDHSVRLAVQGVERIRVIGFLRSEPYILARVAPAPEREDLGTQIEGLSRTVGELFIELVQLAAEPSEDLTIAVRTMLEPRQLAYLIASSLPISVSLRQELLEIDALTDKLRRLAEILQHELAVRRVVQKVTAETSEQISQAQREQILRKHMESIQRELGEVEPEVAESRDLRNQIEKLPLSDEARKEATRELARLERTPAISPEHGIIRTYLDWLTKMPWGKVTGHRVDVERAREVLDEDHYDLKQIKERILDHLAVKHLREARQLELDGDPEYRSEPILCLVGPPGVGKTSLGHSIARALGRAFAHQSFGGIHDEAEIRGHRRTYIGAMPGRIAQALCRAEAQDPVFMLDEVDKLGSGFHGDPSAALLELLDPAQNKAFVDTYLGVPFDLSHVLFICTANTTDTIPPPLLDRMEVLKLSGYTEREKVHIAMRYLIPRQRIANGLRDGEVVIPEETVLRVIRAYTREAGVRGLERELGTILRKSARRISEGARTPIYVHPHTVQEYLGPRRVFDEVAERIDRPGVATGLCWMPSGGEILFVEATMLVGHDRLVLTGMLGNVMRESAEAAVTYLRANAERFGLSAQQIRERRNVHVHVPAGAIPKDGPSAGLTIFVALASYALGRPIRSDVAMTGEITLRGKVLPVGGIKDKVLAAHRVGLRTLILPRRNEPDLEDIPEEVRRVCEFKLVESVDEALAVALDLRAAEELEPVTIQPA
jgi:ATP-dependent Lon protease